MALGTKYEVAAAQAWAASPDYRPYQPPPDQDKMERHLFSWVAENVLTRMFPKAVDDMLHRQALIKAMDLELQRRAKRQQTFELPYDAEHHIVVKPEYGCIVKNEGGQ